MSPRRVDPFRRLLRLALDVADNPLAWAITVRQAAAAELHAAGYHRLAAEVRATLAEPERPAGGPASPLPTEQFRQPNLFDPLGDECAPGATPASTENDHHG